MGNDGCNYLAGGFNQTPLKNDGVKVSWDDDYSQNIWKHEPANLWHFEMISSQRRVFLQITTGCCICCICCKLNDELGGSQESTLWWTNIATENHHF